MFQNKTVLRRLIFLLYANILLNNEGDNDGNQFADDISFFCRFEFNANITVLFEKNRINRQIRDRESTKNQFRQKIIILYKSF